MEAGFYKRTSDGQLHHAPEYVEGQGYILLKTEKDMYTFPVDGWYWFDGAVADSNEGWASPAHSLRIVAPIQLIMDDIGIKMYGWFSINRLPVVNTGTGQVHLYCNEILPEHMGVINNLQGIITIETRP